MSYRDSFEDMLSTYHLMSREFPSSVMEVRDTGVFKPHLGIPSSLPEERVKQIHHRGPCSRASLHFEMMFIKRLLI